MAGMDRLYIRTPEGIVFSLELADPLVRLVAWAFDLLIIAAVSVATLLVVSFFGVFIGPGLSATIAILSLFLMSTGYAIFFEYLWRGQTPGKRLLRLRVMDARGLGLTFSQIMLRNLLRTVDGLPGLYLLGGLSCFFTRHVQRLGDLAANTIVIRTPRIAEPNVDQILPGKYNSFRQYPHLAARLRQRISPVEADLALRALVRRGILNADARVELFQEIADYFRGLQQFPQEATDGLSDEKYVQNVVDLIYRPRGG
jgi:uncharacterized RDD family membrane protein YckC